MHEHIYVYIHIYRVHMCVHTHTQNYLMSKGMESNSYTRFDFTSNIYMFHYIRFPLKEQTGLPRSIKE